MSLSYIAHACAKYWTLTSLREQDRLPSRAASQAQCVANETFTPFVPNGRGFLRLAIRSYSNKKGNRPKPAPCREASQGDSSISWHYLSGERKS
jgi:hypothetical protein